MLVCLKMLDDELVLRVQIIVRVVLQNVWIVLEKKLMVGD